MIYNVNSIDIMAKRKDGGLELFIISTGSIDVSEETQTLLLNKVGKYLNYINSKAFQQEFEDINKNKILIIFELEEKAPKLLMKLCEQIVPWVEKNGATFIVREETKRHV